MRRGIVAATLVAGLLLIGPALSQQPGGRGGRGGFGGGFGGGGLAAMIGINKPLQDELKVDQDQVTKLNDAMTKVREEFRDDMGKLFDQNVPQDERDKIRKKMADANT